MKKIIIMLLVIIMALTHVEMAIADETTIDGVDIMIVIDKSDSINWNDPNRELLEAVYQLLNLSLGVGNRVGFVAYNDTIVAYQGLRLIETADDIEEIMDELHGLHASRGTDIGLALQTARRQLQLDQYRVGQTAIIFLSDGWYEFALFNLNRDQEDVMADVEYVLANVTYPIFSIEYRIPLHQNNASDNEWKQRAGGAHFSVMTRDDRIETVDEVYALILEMAREGGVLPEDEEAIPIYEHQLMFSIPELDEGYHEWVEFTVTGDATIQEILIPAGYDHITIERVGDDFLVTIFEPQQAYYMLSYLSEDEEADELVVVSVVEVEEGISWELVGIVISAVVGLVLLVLVLLRIRKMQQVKKLYPTLNGMLECYFVEIPTGMKNIPIQSWSASFLAANNKTSLMKLLKNVALRVKMPEAEKVFVSINLDNTISIMNHAGLVCYKDGKEVKDVQISLSNGEGLYMVFQRGTIEVELRVKKSSFK